MSVHTPPLAPVVVLAFLGTAFVVSVSLFVVLVGMLRKSRLLAFAGVAAVAVTTFAYVSVLLGLSLLSRDVELPQGAWKYFCEIDCHIANSVVRVQVLPPLQEELQPESAKPRIVVVQLKTWFDPTTVGAHRGNGPLLPGERKVRLIDSKGQRYAEPPMAQIILAHQGLPSTPLRTPLRPGESYDSYVVFEIPPEAHDLRLLLTSAEDLDSAIWGHEISPFHRKAYFAIHGASSTRTGLRQSCRNLTT